MGKRGEIGVLRHVIRRGALMLMLILIMMVVVAVRGDWL